MFGKRYTNFIPIIVDDDNNRLLVEVTLTDLNNRVKTVYLALDTGANSSTLDLSIIDALSLEFYKTLKLNGKVTDVYKVPLINIQGRLKYTNFKMAKGDYSQYEGVFGLFGMDILGQFEFAISLEESRLYFIESKEPLSNLPKPLTTSLLTEVSNYCISDTEFEESLREYEREFMSEADHTLEEIQEYINERD